MVEPTMYEMAIAIVFREVQRDKLKECKKLIKQMLRTSDPATRAVAIMASATLDAVAKIVSDDVE